MLSGRTETTGELLSVVGEDLRDCERTSANKNIITRDVIYPIIDR